MVLFITSFVILTGNIPFGYWRSNVKKFSFQWFLSIHIPIPFIILARIFTHIGFQWYTYFFTVSTFVMGQFLGKSIYTRMKLKYTEFISSFIFCDFYRIYILNSEHGR
ncbi:MAG: hypothetical protein U0W24_17265 [Bacteroidales bacterium]